MVILPFATTTRRLSMQMELALTCNNGGEISKDKENAEAKEKEETKAPCDWEM